jgi:hypothetical protein
VQGVLPQSSGAKQTAQILRMNMIKVGPGFDARPVAQSPTDGEKPKTDAKE